MWSDQGRLLEAVLVLLGRGTGPGAETDVALTLGPMTETGLYHGPSVGQTQDLPSEPAGKQVVTMQARYLGSMASLKVMQAMPSHFQPCREV